MTGFEQFLIDAGYLKYVMDTKTMTYMKTSAHTISTMVNLDHNYIHNTDVILLDKIRNGIDITSIDKEGVICFGLNWLGKPPTLIYPRPRIEIKRIKGDKIVFEDQQYDDSMNVVLATIDYEHILKAMYDRSLIIKIDLTKQ